MKNSLELLKLVSMTTVCQQLINEPIEFFASIKNLLHQRSYTTIIA